MQKTTPISLPEIKLVGLTTRTNNATEENFEAGQMFPLIQKYFHQNMANLILHRKNPGTTFCAYVDYASDHNADYTYFIGEEVEAFDNQPDTLTAYTIPPQTYTKFTNGPAAMPEAVKEPWMKIWQMSAEEMGGQRLYCADFEIYDERATDHNNLILDIYIGIKESL